jgi:hypothetical protein
MRSLYQTACYEVKCISSETEFNDVGDSNNVNSTTNVNGKTGSMQILCKERERETKYKIRVLFMSSLEPAVQPSYVKGDYKLCERFLPINLCRVVIVTQSVPLRL